MSSDLLALSSLAGSVVFLVLLLVNMKVIGFINERVGNGDSLITVLFLRILFEPRE